MGKLLMGLGTIVLTVTACFSTVEANPQRNEQVDLIIRPDSTRVTGLLDPEPIPTKFAKIISKKIFRNGPAWGCEVTVRYIDVTDYPIAFAETKCKDVKTEFLTLKELRARYGDQISDGAAYVMKAGKNKRFLVTTSPKETSLYAVDLEGRLGQQELKR